MVHFEKFPYWQKVPCIPALFENNEYITDFKKKAELFNSFFAKQGSLTNNNNQLSPPLSHKTNERLSSVKITVDDIFKIIAKRMVKVHGHDKIRIRMINICNNSICKPLRLILNHCIENSIYPCEWKKANIVPIHKKEDKEIYKTKTIPRNSIMFKPKYDFKNKI